MNSDNTRGQRHMAGYTHWGVVHHVNPSGRRERLHLGLHSIRRTRGAAMQADLEHFCSLSGEGRWDQWHALRAAGKLRAVKLAIAVVGESA